MTNRQKKKHIKSVKARVANIALGYVPGAKYLDLYNAINHAQEVLERYTKARSPKIVLLAHVGIQDVEEVRRWAQEGKI